MSSASQVGLFVSIFGIVVMCDAARSGYPEFAQLMAWINAFNLTATYALRTRG